MNDIQRNIKFVDVFSFILNLMGSIITIYQFILGCKTGIIWHYITAALLLLILIFLIIFRNKISEYILKYIMNLTCPDKIYKLKSKEVIYEFISREDMKHEKKFNVEVLHDGFIGITDKFKWTGEGELIPEATETDQTIELLDKKFGMQRYKIKFQNNKSYSKHDSVPEMKMMIKNIKDPKHQSSLHLSSGIFEITDCLILHIIFDKNLKPRNIRKLEYLHYSDDEHYKCKKGELTYDSNNDKKEIIWVIRKPFYGGKYMIDWDFE